jgi:hypothetical protein
LLPSGSAGQFVPARLATVELGRPGLAEEVHADQAGDMLTLIATTPEVQATRSGLRRVRRCVEVERTGLRVAKLSTTLVMPA